MSKIITVSREFGSGGRELGKRLSDHLGFAYYDREILEELAKEEDTSEWLTQNLPEQNFAAAIPLHFGRSFSVYQATATQQTVKLMIAEQKLLCHLADRGNCVIVGRGAAALLEQWKPFSIFVYADMPSKLARCRERAPESEHLSDREMIRQIKQVDAQRAKRIQWSTGVKWGDRKGYQLCINTSGISIKTLSAALADYARTVFADGK